jgi:hypothetical protein
MQTNPLHRVLRRLVDHQQSMRIESAVLRNHHALIFTLSEIEDQVLGGDRLPDRGDPPPVGQRVSTRRQFVRWLGEG